MFHLNDAHGFRRMVAGACMIAAPVLLLAGAIVHPEQADGEAAQLAIVRENLDAWYASHMLLLAGLVLAVPAVLGLMHMLREREVAWGHVGGGLALLGLMALVAGVTIDGLVAWQMAAAGADQAEMAALLERIAETTGVFVPVFLLSGAFAVGLVVLALGLYRARAVQSWTALVIAAGAVIAAIAWFAGGEALAIVAMAFLLVGLGTVGRMVLGESDEAWEHTPEHPGFRPLAGMR